MMTQHISIFYDARTIGQNMTGVGRYTLNLLHALATLPQHPRIRALMRPQSLELARRDPKLQNIDLVPTHVSHESHPWGDLWQRWILPRCVRPDEIYHGPAFVIPAGRWSFPRVATIHDLLVFTHPQYYPRRFSWWLRMQIRTACRLAHRIIVPSQSVADEIIKQGLAPVEKIAVIALAPDQTDLLWEAAKSPDYEEISRHIDRWEGPMLISVATRGPRKDIATARRAHILLTENHPAVCWLWVGESGAVADDSPEDLVRHAAERGFVTLGNTPGALLRETLPSATALVSCSHAEGFGLPLVEAMAAGIPIVTADIPVSREVAGEAALYFPPGDAQTLAQVLGQLVAQPELRRDYAQRARQRASQYTWERTAEKTLAVYRQA